MEEEIVSADFYSFYIWFSTILSAPVSLGCLLICYVIVHNSYMQTSFNYYLLNLAITNILSLVNIVIPELCYTSERIINYSILRQLTTFIMFMCSGVTNFITMAINVERYIGICHPFMALYVSRLTRTAKVNISIWGFCFVSCATFKLKECLCTTKEFQFCREIHFEFIGKCIAVGFFILPMIIIVALHVFIRVTIWRSTYFLEYSDDEYIEARRKFKLSDVVNFEFFLCSVPFHLVLYKIVIDPKYLFSKSGVGIFMLTRLLNLLCKSISPIVYYCFGSKFKKAFKALNTKEDIASSQIKVNPVEVSLLRI